MFVQVTQGRAEDPAELRTAMDRWAAELAPGAVGWLGSTSGVTDDGQFVALARFASPAMARRNSDRPEQGAWWAQVSKRLRDVTFSDYDRVHLYKEGGADSARFVQVIRGYTDDMRRLAELGRIEEKWLGQEAQHILGMTVAFHDEGPGDFTQAVYFTNEEEARAWEREHPMGSGSTPPEMSELMTLMKELRYYDLRDPWLHSPR